jgi:phosphatidylglycerophosphatase A
MTLNRRYSITEWLTVAAATGLFLGLIPPRIATIGTLLGIPIAWVLFSFVGWGAYLPVLFVLWCLGVPLCTRAAALLESKDPREVVYDELITLPIVYFMAPSFSMPVIAVGFALHRVFDITKPWGVCHAERLPGGLGIMSDDAVASLYALACMHVLYWTKLL